MKKQALTPIEIETIALSTSTALDERQRPISEDSEAYPSKPESRRRSALRWFVDTLALAGGGMAGVYVGVWLDQPNVAAPPPRLPTVDEKGVSR